MITLPLLPVLGILIYSFYFRQSKRMSTFTLGERGWLDGFDGCNDDGVFFVTSLRDNSILLLQWSSLSDQDSSNT